MREQAFIELLRRHDERGAEALLTHCGPLMRYIIAPILPDPRDQEECLSEVVMRVWEKIGLYDPDRGTWTGWLTALTRNTALNRARQVRRSESPEELTGDVPSPEPTPEERVLQGEQRRVLEYALRQLSPGDKTLFYRKYYYLQSTAQIATELGMTPRAVEGRLYRLKKRLRGILGGDGHE